MKKQNNANALAASLLALTLSNMAHADEIEILAADFHHNEGDHCSVKVTLKHEDKGWDH